MTDLAAGNIPCGCGLSEHSPRLVVVTGGPGAGKTAVLELARRSFCEHVLVLPEAASIVFGGGFPRQSSLPARRAAQRAIFHIQRQLESIVLEERKVAVALCDRGTIDGLAYWPDTSVEYFDQLDTSLSAEFGRYHAVIHLRTPSASSGYVQSPLRVESAEEASDIDRRIAEVWRDHPKYSQIPSRSGFSVKALEVLAQLRDQLPACCSSHPLHPAQE